MKKLIHRILLGINVLTGLALLLSYLAVHINPDTFALPAFFGLAYPYLLLVNVIMIITWAMLLRYEAFISIVIIALGFSHFINYLQLFRTKGEKNNTFKVLSYNVHTFSYIERPGPSTQKNIFSLIKSQQPDILCLQEFFTTGDPSQVQPMVNSATEMKFNSHVKMLGKGKSRHYGIGTFSRYPIIKKGEIMHPGSSSLTIYTDVIIQKDTFRIFNNHLESFRLKPIERTFIEEMTGTDEKTIRQMRNLYGRLRRGFASRARQAQTLRENIRKSPYPVIVTGDFNDTPVSYAYRMIRKGLNDSFVNSGYGAGFTYRGYYPPNRIDYILYDDALVNNHFEILKVKFSDHYPVVAYFRKQQKGAS